jgi:hypothetical protein
MKRDEAKLALEKVKSLDWAAVEAALGVKISFGKVIYDDTPGAGCNIKLILAPTVLNGQPVDLGKVEYLKYALLYGLKTEWYGAELVFGSKRLKIAGFRPRGRKQVVLKDEAGGSYVVTTDVVIQRLGNPDAVFA